MLPKIGTRVKITKDLYDSDDNEIIVYKDQLAVVAGYFDDTITVTFNATEELVLLEEDEYEEMSTGV